MTARTPLQGINISSIERWWWSWDVGPAPYPKSLKLRNGGHPKRINWHEPTPRPALPELPPDVSDEVRSVWGRLVGELVEMGTAHDADQDCLYALRGAIVTHRRACRRLASEDVIIDGLHGPVRSPVVAQARDAANLVRALAQEFGLIPSARSRIDVGVKPRDSDGSTPFAGGG